MEKNVIKNAKFVKIIGIITTISFLILSIFFGITAGMIASICFLPFVALGLILIIGYEREKIIVEENSLTFCYILKKSRNIKYHDIRCLLLVPLNHRKQMVLVDKQYNRLNDVHYGLANLEILFEALAKNNIPIVDLGEMVEKKKDTAHYLNALNRIEKNYYKTIADETQIVESLSKGKNKLNITKTKKKLKIVGWILILSNAAAFFIGGKIMVFIYISILLTAYAIYIHYYPYIYIETSTKKGQETVLQMPFMGAIIAMLSSLSVSKIFNYDFGSLIKITGFLTVLLIIPFFVKTIRADLPQRLGRKLSVIFATLFLSFSITFPINFLLTFDKPEHETIIITNKDTNTKRHSGTDYSLYGNWNGKETKFYVSRSIYNSTSIGDVRRICIRKSALGLAYYTIHK